ncbi:MAG: Ig-like domain-containing protein [Clostridia bacterium]|nr:Ig-like domain-containing protein [Clostridia bacterium]
MRKVIICILVLLTFTACFTACKKSKDKTQTPPVTSTPVTSSPTSEPPAYTIEISQSEVNLFVGDTLQLEAIVSKPNVYVFWSVQDSSIAKVSDEGEITALAVGQTICYAKFGGQEAMCLIKVSPKQATPMLSVEVGHINNSLTMYLGDVVNVNATVKLGDDVVDGASVEYALSSEGIVSIEDNVIVSKAVGTVEIEVKVSYQGQEATVTLTVTVIEP